MSTTENPEYTVLPSKLGGGPHGLGDPNDNSLRTIEKEVIVGRYIKKKAHEKCVDVVKKFNECGKNAGLLVAFKCRGETVTMNNCLKIWYENEDFRKECLTKYLEERSEYRRTGISKKMKDQKI